MAEKFFVASQRQPDYWWGGPCIGFTTILESAIGYVSAEVACKAAEVVDAMVRADFPNLSRLRAVRVTYHYDSVLMHPFGQVKVPTIDRVESL